MRSPKKWVRFSILIALLGLVMGQSKCPEYSKPDDTGALPAGTPPTALFFADEDNLCVRAFGRRASGLWRTESPVRPVCSPASAQLPT